MQSSLIPERPLIISPTLAATIGLEEAVLLHVLCELMAHRPCTVARGMRWLELDQQSLLDALPFWAWIDIRRVQKNLQDLGLLLVDPNTGQGDSWRFAINQPVSGQDASTPPPAQPPTRAGTAAGLSTTGPSAAAPSTTAPVNSVASHSTTTQPPSQTSSPFKVAASVAPTAGGRQRSQGGAEYIAADWQPDQEWLALCRQHGIPQEFALNLVPEFVMYWRDRAQSRFSWGNAFYRHALREWRREQTRRGAGEMDTTMTAQWRPSQDAVDILVRAEISEAFIEDAVPEFVLYWRERGAQDGAWNTRFIEHIRRQWARYQQSRRHDGVPRPILADWQPADDVYDVLRLAEIDEEFARAKVPEFVLYWRDSGQAHTSWNTRFLQFIKYSWARRPEAARMGWPAGSPFSGQSGGQRSGQASTGLTQAGNDTDQHVAGSGRQSLDAAFRRFTDRSWAE